MKQNEVSRAAIGRIPSYIKYLKELPADVLNISATSVSKGLGLGEVQVRKDLSSISGAGKPKTGYSVKDLIKCLEDFLGYGKQNYAIIVGAGKLGKALLDYGGFKEYGFEIAAAFDDSVSDEEIINENNKIFPMSRLGAFCKDKNIKIGIIAVPGDAAQNVCDILLQNNIKAILNFAPCVLNVPPNIPVRYENMALSLAYLNYQINQKT